MHKKCWNWNVQVLCAITIFFEPFALGRWLGFQWKGSFLNNSQFFPLICSPLPLALLPISLVLTFLIKKTMGKTSIIYLASSMVLTKSNIFLEARDVQNVFDVISLLLNLARIILSPLILWRFFFLQWWLKFFFVLTTKH